MKKSVERVCIRCRCRLRTAAAASLLCAYASYVQPAVGQGIEISELVDVSDRVTVRYAGNVFNRVTREQVFQATMTNTSERSVLTPLVLVITSVSDPSITLANPSGTTAAGEPFIDFSGVVGDGKLAPGETTASLPIRFNNPLRRRLSFTGQCFGQIILAPPTVTVTLGMRS